MLSEVLCTHSRLQTCCSSSTRVESQTYIVAAVACRTLRPAGTWSSRVPCRLQAQRIVRRQGQVVAAAKAPDINEIAECLPQSREEAVQQALQAINSQFVAKESKKKNKGFKTSYLKKLAVEIPVADQSPAAVVNLALEVAAGLPKKLDPCRIIFCEENAADLCSEADTGFISFFLEDCYDQELDGSLLIVNPSPQQVGKVEQMVSLWRGPGVVVLNADWSSGVDAKHTAFVSSLETVYCFLPLAVQGFLSAREGIVLKWVRQGSPAASPWYIFSQQGDKYIVVGNQQRRPLQEDMELALYNAIAAQSPVTAAVKMFRQLQDKVTKKE